MHTDLCLKKTELETQFKNLDTALLDYGEEVTEELKLTLLQQKGKSKRNVSARKGCCVRRSTNSISQFGQRHSPAASPSTIRLPATVVINLAIPATGADSPNTIKKLVAAKSCSRDTRRSSLSRGPSKFVPERMRAPKMEEQKGTEACANSFDLSWAGDEDMTVESEKRKVDVMRQILGERSKKRPQKKEKPKIVIIPIQAATVFDRAIKRTRQKLEKEEDSEGSISFGLITKDEADYPRQLTKSPQTRIDMTQLRPELRQLVLANCRTNSPAPAGSRRMTISHTPSMFSSGNRSLTPKSSFVKTREIYKQMR